MLSIEELDAEVAQTAPVLVGAALALSGVVMGMLVIALSRIWIPGRKDFIARWGFTHLALVAVAWVLGQVLIPTLWALVTGDAEFSINEKLFIMALLFLIPATMIFRWARELDPEGLRCLGFRAQGTPRSAVFGVAAYVLLIPGLLGALILWPAVLEAFGYATQPQDVMRFFLDLQGGALVIPVLFAVLVVPFFEELTFRSFLQPLLVQKLGAAGGIVATSLLFAALHGLSAFGLVFVLSLIMGGVMHRTQRFASCYAVHALHNGLTIWAILTFSELREMVEVGSSLLGLLGLR